MNVRKYEKISTYRLEMVDIPIYPVHSHTYCLDYWHTFSMNTLNHVIDRQFSKIVTENSGSFRNPVSNDTSTETENCYRSLFDIHCPKFLLIIFNVFLFIV